MWDGRQVNSRLTNITAINIPSTDRGLSDADPRGSTHSWQHYSLIMTTTFNENVYFLGVARLAGQGIVVASYSYNTDTDLSGVKQVLEQPNMNMSPGKHYSFAVGQMAWHLIAGMLILQLLWPC